MQDFGAQTRQFQHFFKGNLLEPSRPLDDTRIRRVDTFHVCADFTFIGLQGGR